VLAGPTSLDRPVGPAGEDSAEPGAMIADGSPQAALEERVVEAIEAASTSVALEDALHGLTQSEHTVIVLRHGIGGRQAKKLADVAEELGLSRVRVRQLQHRAEDALRAETPANLALAAGG
jgi:RNA polymerase primary sigma factor